MNHSTILKALHHAVIAKHLFVKDVEFSNYIERDIQAAYDLLFPWLFQCTTVTLMDGAALIKTEVEIENDRFVVLASHLDYASGKIIQ